MLSGFAVAAFGAGLNAIQPSPDGPLGSADGVTAAQDIGAQEWDGITRLDLQLCAGRLTVRTGEEASLKLGNDIAKYCSYEFDNGTFKLRDSRAGRKSSGLNGFRFNTRITEKDEVVLTVPSRQDAFESIGIELGAGEGILSGLKSAQIKLDSGAGEFTADSLEADKIVASSGAGVFNAKGLKVSERFEFSSGVGECRVQGDLRGKIKISGGVGTTELLLSGSESEYEVDASSGIGKCVIGGTRTSFLDGGSHTNRGADNKIEISGGVGDVYVEFDQEKM